MSYSITVAKDAQGVRVTSSSGLSDVPDGIFIISGHTPAPLGSDPASGISRVASLAVSLTKAGGPYGAIVATCSSSYLLPAESAPAEASS